MIKQQNGCAPPTKICFLRLWTHTRTRTHMHTHAHTHTHTHTHTPTHVHTHTHGLHRQKQFQEIRHMPKCIWYYSLTEPVYGSKL